MCMRMLVSAETWKMKRTWIAALIALRGLYVAMNNAGMNPFKKSLQDDHVFLTGAGGGLGRGMAIKLGLLGCKLSISDVNMSGLEETKAKCIAAGIKAENVCIFKCDVANLDSIKEAANTARNAFGTVTILINNAGIVSGTTLMNLSPKMIEMNLKVNTISHLHTIREFLPGMIQKKRGHLVSIASAAGLLGVPGLADYNASKFGAVGLDEAVRLELMKQGHSGYIKNTCICPFFINTGMFDGAKRALIFDILEEDWAVNRIVAAIRQEEQLVVMPWLVNVVFLMKLFPPVIADRMAKIVGAH